MSENNYTRPDVEKILSGLKDFQKKSVDYIFRRLYIDEDQVTRFLIADEVGLGKTLVARGLIAKAIDHLWDTIDRIDVVYICSNQDIAQQNIDRLNITNVPDFQFASRATLLPITMHQIKENKLNFVSLTPGTSFNLRSRAGRAWERVVLLHMLRKAWGIEGFTLSNVMRSSVQKKNWRPSVAWFRKNKEIDATLQSAFEKELISHPELREQYEDVAEKIGPRRKHIPSEVAYERDRLIGNLRRVLARSSLGELEPDLVILDEFQRFKNVLREKDDMAFLAKQLFDYKDAKVLLLSATPYKMYTIHGEVGEDHYKDFLDTISFLLRDDPIQQTRLESALAQYRDAIFRFGYDSYSRNSLKEARVSIEEILRKVMVRTERLAASKDRNGMLNEKSIAGGMIEVDDLKSYVQLDKLSNLIFAGDQVEYWKSSAYPINLMDDYKLKRQFKKSITQPDNQNLYEHLKRAEPHLLNWETIQAYEQIDPGNARLRALIAETVDTSNWRLLWLPAALPYYSAQGPYADIQEAGFSKTLVFSAWRVVPKVISVLISYEAERRMIKDSHVDYQYAELTEKRRPLLRFNISRDKPAGMSLFNLIYPCLTLSKLIDPLEISKRKKQNGAPTAVDVRTDQETKDKILKSLEMASAKIRYDKNGPEDERWYWASLILLDRYHESNTVNAWFDSSEPEHVWNEMLRSDADDDGDSGFSEHIYILDNCLKNPDELKLGRWPEDLIEVLSDVALSNPSVCVLRAMMRCLDNDGTSPDFLAAAAKVGLGFRTLFNQPASILMLQQFFPDVPYWLKSLHYCFDGNIQAVLDEFVHILYESLGLFDHQPGECVLKIANTIHQAVSIRTPTLSFDEVCFNEDSSIEIKPRRIRCRYALRYGDDKHQLFDDDNRMVDVRVAFNSPFRPYILATTSVGQEGLDFHQYCHRIVHWNLPSNPVDLEQREGRVHRYKGHVIRRNLVERYGLDAIHIDGREQIDPWKQLFEKAEQERPEGVGDIIPYWIFEDKYFIERQLPILTLSTENGQIERLKKSLVAYRSVIGQPRQQELLEYLEGKLTPEELREISSELMIDLSPP